MPYEIDSIAREIALRRSGLHECLHVPIAAVNEEAITTYIGEVVQTLANGTPKKALLVKAKAPPPIDQRLSIWGVEGSATLHRQLQVWVHVAYTRYRRAYKKAFPTEEIADKVLSHAMSRRIAVLKGFQYVRITPVSRGSNSSSGFTESWGVNLYSVPEQSPEKARRGAFIQYADLADLMLMMDMKLGGGVMNAVNEGQALVKLKP
jgi:hypothetical protein